MLLPSAVGATTVDPPPETQVENPAAQPAAGTGEEWGENQKPQHYVPSKGPSEDGRAYNWVQMGYAGILMIVMLGFMFWLVKRTPRKSRK